MISDYFDIIGVWRLTSEDSEELIDFRSDGQYFIFYRHPFRIIEVGEWLIDHENLVLFASNVEVTSRIISLTEKELELSRPGEFADRLSDSFVKIA